jgi:hypothetical protein
VRRLAVFALALGLFACGGERPVSDSHRQAIESLLTDYTRLLGEAYRAADGTLLAPVATEREQQRVATSIAELAAEGRALRPVFRRMTIESIAPAFRTTYHVDTFEIWDLRVVALGSEQTVSESPAQENRLTYTVIRDGDEWHVLSRVLRSSTQPS